MIAVLHPQFLYVIPPAILLLIIILKLDFLRAKDDDFRRKDRRKMKAIILISRALIITCILLALSAPFVELTIEERGPPRLTILIDRSRSMDLFGVDTDSLKASLEKKLPVKVATIGRNTTSNLGEGILSNMEAETNVLLVTDGYSNSGITLGEVAMRAASVNTTISALDLTAKKDDAAVVLVGEPKAFTDVDYTFEARLTATKDVGVPLTILLDDAVIYDQKTTDRKVSFTQKFEPGVHTITAQIKEDDYFSQNNIFYKTVKVIDKPKVLLLSHSNDPLEQLLGKLYAVEKVATIPADLSPYYAIIIDDIPASELNKDTQLLTNYLTDGNGILVVGGFNSFDRGAYKNSLFETILPVKVGAAEKKRGNSNIVLVIDISGASDIQYQGKTISPLDVNKALAIEVVKTLNIANRVGVVAFNDKVYKVEDISQLFNNKASIEDKVSRLVGGGQSSFDVGLKGAYEMLKSVKGDKDIIILTDGLAYADVQERTKSVANSLHALGITTYVVGVGRNVQDQFLGDLAQVGGGIYFPASESNRLSILFGTPEDVKQGSDFGLMILNPSHFITKGLSINAVMNGYNEVVPKSAARMLVTTSGGGPALTVWNYGVGRVGTINVFTGGNLGTLLSEQNSIILSRSINWLIGDPERKQEYLVIIDDGYIDQPFIVRVKAAKRPEAAGFEFFKADTDLYESGKFYANATGFNSVLATTFAVNSQKEFAFVGQNPGLAKIAESTGGKLFKPENTDEIADFMTKASHKQRLKKVFFTWPFLTIAIIIFLVEIFIRKSQEHLKEGKHDA